MCVYPALAASSVDGRRRRHHRRHHRHAASAQAAKPPPPRAPLRHPSFPPYRRLRRPHHHHRRGPTARAASATTARPTALTPPPRRNRLHSDQTDGWRYIHGLDQIQNGSRQSVHVEFASPTSVTSTWHASVLTSIGNAATFRLDPAPGPQSSFQFKAKGPNQMALQGLLRAIRALAPNLSCSNRRAQAVKRGQRLDSPPLLHPLCGGPTSRWPSALKPNR